MTKNEALKLAIDGKKVRNTCWPDEDYLIFSEKNFILPVSDVIYGSRYGEGSQWELYEEPKEEEKECPHQFATKTLVSFLDGIDRNSCTCTQCGKQLNPLHEDYKEKNPPTNIDWEKVKGSINYLESLYPF